MAKIKKPIVFGNVDKIKLVPLPEIGSTVVARSKEDMAFMVQALEAIPAGQKLTLTFTGFPGTPKDIKQGEIFWLLVKKGVEI